MDLLENKYEREYRSTAQHKWRPSMRRLSDILLGILLILLLSPLFLYISILILKKEGRPIFHREICTGRKNRSFTMWKFRTLSNPSRLITSLPPYPYPEPSGRRTARTITATGRSLKKYKFERIPLLINILIGDLSFTDLKTGENHSEYSKPQ
ncbi:sugar transferase [Virgibacillus oceani]